MLALTSKCCALLKPGSTQEYTISNARIVPQNGNNLYLKANTRDKKIPLNVYMLLWLTLN